MKARGLIARTQAQGQQEGCDEEGEGRVFIQRHKREKTECSKIW